jgi:hypothetical protein
MFRFIEWLAPSLVFVAVICHAFDLYPIGVKWCQDDAVFNKPDRKDGGKS